MKGLTYENFGGIDALRLSDIDVPKVANDEVLIQVLATSINVFDRKLRQGLLRDFFKVGFPITPGRDGCGVVVSCGTDVPEDAFEIGARVGFLSSRLQNGAMAKFVAVKASSVVVVPKEMNIDQCAALPLVGLSAWNALVDTAALTSGMRLLVHGGSGGVGSIAIQIARHIGAEVFTTCSAARASGVEELGATAIPYDLADFTQAISRCDVVFDTVGGETHEKSYAVLKPGGTLVYLVAQPFHDLSENYRVNTRQAIVQGRTANLRPLLGLAAKGVIRSNVECTFPIGEFKAAFEHVENGRAQGKVVLEF